MEVSALRSCDLKEVLQVIFGVMRNKEAHATTHHVDYVPAKDFVSE